MSNSYYIKPLNTLFFRSGKPFGGVDDLFGEAAGFPPSPSNVYGSIRSLLFRNLDEDLDSTKFELRQIFYISNDEVFLPMPSILLARKQDLQKESDIELRRAELISTENLVVNTDLPYILVAPEANEDVYKTVGGFISINNLVSFLSGENVIIEQPFKLLRNLKSFRKTGNKRDDKSKTVEEGKLFTFEGYEFKDFSFYVEIDREFDLSLLKLGAENKIAVIEPAEDIFSISTGIKTDMLLVYFATPTVIQKYTNILDKLSIKGELIAYSLPKLKNIGGFDIVSGKPKPMYRFIPEGSIFVFKLDEEVEIDEFQGTKIVDPEIESQFLEMFPHQASLSSQGFGIAYFGTFKI